MSAKGDSDGLPLIPFFYIEFDLFRVADLVYISTLFAVIKLSVRSIVQYVLKLKIIVVIRRALV